MNEIRLYFDDVYFDVPGGDILLWRAGWRPSSLLIARGSRSIYSHVAMTAWWSQVEPNPSLCEPWRCDEGNYFANPLPHRRLVLLDTLQWVGGRRKSVEDTVAVHPGRWEWYHVRSDLPYDRRAAVAKAAEIVGLRYGWGALAWAAIRNAAVMRWILPPDRDDDTNGMLPHCAAAASAAMKAGGLDPVPHCSNRSTTPGDLERSATLEYRGTLYGEAR